MSNVIQSTRKDLGMTGDELARLLNVTRGAVSQMERSERDGSIKLETLRRTLLAMGKSAEITVRPENPSSKYSPERLTQTVNRALDQGDTSFALRALTRATQELRENPEEFDRDALESRSSQIQDPRWEALFRALYSEALPDGVSPAWAEPERLSRPWFVSQFSPLQDRARTTTPRFLRDLNIFIDERSLTRA
jgi:transcriptional regulator with XRE-family HTH domain